MKKSGEGQDKWWVTSLADSQIWPQLTRSPWWESLQTLSRETMNHQSMRSSRIIYSPEWRIQPSGIWETWLKKNGALALLVGEYSAMIFQGSKDQTSCSSTRTYLTKLRTESVKWIGMPSSKNLRKGCSKSATVTNFHRSLIWETRCWKTKSRVTILLVWKNWSLEKLSSYLRRTRFR